MPAMLHITLDAPILFQTILEFVTDLDVCTNMYKKYRVFFFLWIQSGGCKSAILRSFKQFLYILHN